MTTSFFSGSFAARLDEKGRFVLPQIYRYQLIEEGKLEFFLALGISGHCLAIYKNECIQEIASQMQGKRYYARFQKFFTLFFSTLVPTTCDKAGRVMIPLNLRRVVGLEKEQDIFIVGALNKVEIWAGPLYESEISLMLSEGGGMAAFQAQMKEAFSDPNGENSLSPSLANIMECV